VNNAGAFSGGSVLMEDTQEAYDNIFGVNVSRMYFTAQAVAKHMIEKKIKGQIINTASISASVIPPGMNIYAASKAAVVSLTK
jgi:NAD(P)-dependent dehydrogenase (short-subunit alcohol dehydrogenase family)